MWVLQFSDPNETIAGARALIREATPDGKAVPTVKRDRWGAGRGFEVEGEHDTLERIEEFIRGRGWEANVYMPTTSDSDRPSADEAFKIWGIEDKGA